jgi:large subunit ribosomal protein L9
MSKSVEIILIKDIKGVGKIGDRKKLSGGYVRNYLIPNNLALLITPNNLMKFESIKKQDNKRRLEEQKDAELLKQSLEGKTISITAVAQNEGKLYGSVTIGDVINEITNNFNVKLDKKQIAMPEHLKKAGDYDININLHSEVVCKMKLTVIGQVKKEEPKEDKKDTAKEKAKSKEEEIKTD